MIDYVQLWFFVWPRGIKPLTQLLLFGAGPKKFMFDKGQALGAELGGVENFFTQIFGWVNGNRHMVNIGWPNIRRREALGDGSCRKTPGGFIPGEALFLHRHQYLPLFNQAGGGVVKEMIDSHYYHLANPLSFECFRYRRPEGGRAVTGGRAPVLASEQKFTY